MTPREQGWQLRRERYGQQGRTCFPTQGQNSEAQARLDGMVACLRGQPFVCPYPLGTIRSRAWSKGYRVAEIRP